MAEVGLSVGVDVVDIEDFSATLDRSGAQFISDVFTKDEIAYCKNRRPQHYSVRWAAKEAFFKATNGSLPSDANYREVEITPDASGVPQLRLSGAAARWAREVGLSGSSVSLSHSRRTSMAAVILRFRSRPALSRDVQQLLQTMMGTCQRLWRAGRERYQRPGYSHSVHALRTRALRTLKLTQTHKENGYEDCQRRDSVG
jgi:holo-[acyl-carrier protein] synthase